VKIEEDEEITWEKATQTIKRASHYLSALQTSDGHWPAHLGGCQFFTPIMVNSTYLKCSLIIYLKLVIKIKSEHISSVPTLSLYFV